MRITEAKIQVYESLARLALRVVFAIVFLAAFCVMLGFLLYFCLKSKGPEITVPLGALGTVLAGTLYPTVRWLFPGHERL